MRSLWGFLAAIALAVLAGVAVIYSGIFSIAASVPHTAPERWVLQTAKEAIGDLGKTGITLTRRVPVLSRDEFGKLTHDTNLFLDRMGSAAGDLKGFCDDLQQVSERLSAARREIERQLPATPSDDRAGLIEQLAELRAPEEAAQRSASQAAATLDELTQGEQEERHRRSANREYGNHEGDAS